MKFVIELDVKETKDAKITSEMIEHIVSEIDSGLELAFEIDSFEDDDEISHEFEFSVESVKPKIV